MPWKESSVTDERMRFVIRIKDGESMASLCRQFGISRKTGSKILDRYEESGVEQGPGIFHEVCAAPIPNRMA
jgi:transposase